MNNETMVKLQHFFSVDVRIKKEIYNMAPVMFDKYIDDVSVNKYVDKLNDSLIYIFSELKCIVMDVFGNEFGVFDRVCYLEDVTMNSFYSCGFDIDKLKLFYHKFISNMEEDFVNSVKGECMGHLLYRNLPVEKISSINELLHLIHAYVVNNESILEAVPLINEKYNNNEEKVSLRGVRNSIFENLFMLFPKDLDCGITDMVIINDKKFIMMIRDLGHALSMEITLNGNVARVQYFIPKLCNIEMINNLPGINKVNENSVGATGVIEVAIESLPSTLFSFISKVPTDADIVSNKRR